MSQKFLQKKSNRYLQQPLPENLIANKSIGKREKYRLRGGMVFQNYSRMEKDICSQWLFSWNTSTPGPTQGKRFEFQAPVQREWGVGGNLFPGKTIMASDTHILEEKISGALGGKLIERLNQVLSSAEQMPAHHKTCQQSAQNSQMSFTRGNKLPSYSAPPEEGDNNFSINARPIKVPGAHLPAYSVFYTPYIIGGGPGVGITTAALVCRRISEGVFHSIYSLNERARLFTRGDKLSQDYKNQLTECKKVAILYGNLSKKRLVRTMRDAKKVGGSLHSNFFSLLERRLDVALKRACLFPTIKSARHWIHRRKIQVNGEICTAPSYQLQPADFVTIIPQARHAWKRECMQLFAASAERKAGTTKERRLGSRIAPQPSTPLGPHRVSRPRRFTPSPRLMGKLQEWGALWGNSPRPFPDHEWRMSPSENFPHPTFSRELVQLHFSTKSALASYLIAANKVPSINSLQLVHRAHTTIMHAILRRGKQNPRRATQPPSPMGKKGTGAEQFSLSPSILRQTVWLQQQQAHVVDGLYSYRCNRLFAEKKSSIEKVYDWRYSCIKPLHLECSYVLPAMIFLYVPQKLAWPASINVSLLRKALLP